MKGLQRQKRYSILNSCFSLGVRKFGGKFPFFSKVFLEELRCSTRASKAMFGRGRHGFITIWSEIRLNIFWIHLDNPKKTQWTAHCQNILYNILCVLLNTPDYTWILWIILPTLEIPWMLLENCTKQDMSESVDCQECRSKLLASQSVEDRNASKIDLLARKIDLLWHCQLETHSLGKIQNFPLFNDFKSFSFLLPCYSVTLPSVAISKPGKSELVRFPSFWICGYVPDVCGICGGFAGNFLRFHVVFRLLTTIPRHLKIPWTFKQFSKSGIVGVSGVFDIKIHSF